MIDLSDEEIVRLCRLGAPGAFDALVERHQRTVYGVALRMMRDRDEAEDVAQAVFVKIYEKLNTYDDQHKFFSWMYRIAVNECLNALKYKSRFDAIEGVDVAEEHDEGADDAVVESEAKVQNGLMALKIEQRALVVLRHMQGLSYEEIGQVLDLPAKTVKSRLFSARQALKEILKRKGFR
jgi:RNA polymerase sigma-70 factor (ECF subfamily)